MKFVLAAAVVLAAVLMVGCVGATKVLPATSRSNFPTQGYVQINSIEDLDPRMPILLSVKREINTGLRFESAVSKSPIRLYADSYIDKISELGDVKVDSELKLLQKRTLASIGKTVLDELRSELAASDLLDLESLRGERVEQGRELLQAEMEKIQDGVDQEVAENKIDSARVSSLRMQIAAMELNQNPPPTAPKGYWAKAELVRKADLAQVMGSYNAIIQDIYARRSIEVNEERASIDASISTELDQANTDLESKRNKEIMLAENRFRTEQQNLNKEDDSVFADAQALLALSKTSDQQSNGIRANAVQTAELPSQRTATLDQYKLKLEASILTDAYATVTSISKELHMKIVRRKAGIPDVTSVVIQSIKDRNWKVS